MDIKIKRLTLDSVTPELSNKGDAGLDLRTTVPATLKAGCAAVLPTGLSIALPEGTYGDIKPRSKLAARYGIITGACVVDSNYRGEVMVNLINVGQYDLDLRAGDKIAQMVVTPHKSDLPIVEVTELDETDRGGKGINSSEMRLR